MRYRTKLALWLVTLVVGCVALLAWRSERIFNRGFDALCTTAFDDAEKILELLARERGRRAERLIGLLERNAVVAKLTGKPIDFDGWLEQYAPAEDLLLVVKADGKLDYASAGRGAVADVDQRVELDEAFLDQRQAVALLRGLTPTEGGMRRGAMLWSGPRIRSEDPSDDRKLKALDRNLYFAAAATIGGAVAGDGGILGVAMLATSDVELKQLAKLKVDVVFADGPLPIGHTFDFKDGVPKGQGDRRAADAARWLLTDGKAGPGGRELVTLGGVSYFARPLDVEKLIPGLVNGPVRAALLFDRSEGLAALKETRRGLQILAVVLVLLTAVAATVLSTRVTGPLQAVSVAAERLGAGDTAVRVQETAQKDEVGALVKSFNAMAAALRERDVIRDALGRYVSPDMARQLLERGDQIDLNGQRRRLTVLFGDLAGFTAHVEKRAPPDIVAFVNNYLDDMVEILHRHGAYVEKFEGDTFMAFWGAPLPDRDQAQHACLAALAMAGAVESAKGQWAEQGFPNLSVRWGLNSGDVVVGNMGPSDKVNYSAIGREVNLASALEEANAVYGTAVLITESVHAEVKNLVEAREIDLIRVKGKQEPVRIYELLARKGELTPERERARAFFAEGLALYRGGRFAEARAKFEETQTTLGLEDEPSRLFMERCEALQKSPPPADWDGVSSLA